MEPMATLSQVMEKLKNKGITNEIKLNDYNQIVDTNDNKIKAGDLTIIKTYRFEGDSNPADNTALYLTKDKDENLAYIIDTYGAYSDHAGPKFDEFLKSIKVDETEYDL